jgi:DNA-binding LytR/AlgR family response regulator
MNSLNVLIVEDNQEEAKLLEETLKALSYEVAGIADSLETALGLFYAHNPDVLIVDIMLHGKKDGISIAEKINETPSHRKPVIFLTHLMDQETFEMAKKTNPFNYLLKPFHARELGFSIELAVELSLQSPGLFTANSENSALVREEIYFKKGNYLFKVPLAEIDSIEVDGKYCSVNASQNRFLVQKSLKDLETELPPSFCRIHRNHIINTSNIKRIDTAYMEVELNNQKIIPVSKTFRSALFHRLQIIQ